MATVYPATVRPADLRDAHVAARLAYSLLLDHARIAPDQYRPSGNERSFRELWVAYFQRFVERGDAQALVAENAGRFLGYALCALREKPPIVSGPPDLVVYEIAVVPELRGRGIGRAILQAACDWGRAQGAVQVCLHVHVANARAVGFYEREGFRQCELVMYREI